MPRKILPVKSGHSYESGELVNLMQCKNDKVISSILVLFLVSSCKSFPSSRASHSESREKINGYNQFEVFKDPTDGARGLLGYDEKKNTTKLCEGKLDESSASQTIDYKLDIKDSDSISASLPLGLSLPADAKAELSVQKATKLTIKLIDPKEYRLLDYQLTERAKSDPAYRDEKCIVGLLYAEKIKVFIEVEDSQKVAGGTKVLNYDLMVSKSNETSSKSQKSAEKVFVGYISTLPGASRSGAVARSAVLPGWGQFYKGESMKGSLFTGGFLLTSLVTATAYGNYNSKKNEYNDARTADVLANLSYTGFSPIGVLTYSQASSLSGQANQAGNFLQTTVYGLGALYIFNLFDAFFLGSTTGGGTAMQESPYRVHYNYYATNLGNYGRQDNYELGLIRSF